VTAETTLLNGSADFAALVTAFNGLLSARLTAKQDVNQAEMDLYDASSNYDASLSQLSTIDKAEDPVGWDNLQTALYGGANGGTVGLYEGDPATLPYGQYLLRS